MKFSASQAAMIIEVMSPNAISVWANRNLIVPDSIERLSSKKKIFRFSFVNVFQAALLKEMGDYFLIQYEFLNKLKDEESGLGSKQLEHAIKERKGFIVISDRASGKIFVERSQASQEVQAIDVRLIEKKEDIVGTITESRYVLVLNIAEITKRLLNKIEGFEKCGW